jgi:hypothetical protein
MSGAPAIDSAPATEPTPAADSAPATEKAPAADNAVAAASAAASAAAAAVSAAIAATAAHNVARARNAEVNPAVAPASTVQALKPAQPPFTVHYERPPGRDVPGLVRANHDDEAASAVTAAPVLPAVQESVPSPMPINSYQGEAIERNAVGNPSWKARVVGPMAGVAATLLAAGSALGHSVGSRLSPTKPVRETPSASAAAAQLGIQPPEPAAPSPYARPPYAQAAPYAPLGAVPVGRVADLPAPTVVRPAGFKGTAPYRLLALAGSVLAVVCLPIILGLGRLALIPAHAISGRLSGRGGGGGVGTATPDFDEYGNPRKKRRISPLWLAFGGFYGFLAMIIAIVWLSTSVLPPVEADQSPNSSHAVAALTSNSPSENLNVSHGPSVAAPKPTPKPVTPGSTARTVPPSATTTAPAPTARITPAPKTTATPAPKTTATPAPKTTATPTPTPTPTPTAPVNFVAFVPAGGVRSNGTKNYAAAYTAAYDTGGLVVIIDALGGSYCTLSSTAHTSKSASVTILGTPPQVGSMIRIWGKYWAKGTYTITASCTHSGMPTRQATKQVTIT